MTSRLAFALAVVMTVRSASRAYTTPPWTPDIGNGRYRNPVLFADYSDPDVVRVGDDYWLTSSSFNHVPGLPILHSRDLVNWEIVNHALPKLDYPDAAGHSLERHFRTPRHGAGVWAPSIRFHEGVFRIYFPDPDHGIYVTTASDPRGKWSPPVLVKAGRGLIDPCPLWDDDGKVYLVHAWARSRSGRNNLLTLNRLSPDATRVIDGAGTDIIDENAPGRNYTTLEGPKFYKHGGYYWIFAPIGGVPDGVQVVYRSRHVRGPYAARIVLAQGTTDVNGPHQGAWVQTPSGQNWFLHFQDRGPFGRVVHLEPMTWGADGWPRMGTAVETAARTGQPVVVWTKPDAGQSARAAGVERSHRNSNAPTKIVVPALSDEFDRRMPGEQWQWQANPEPEWASMTSRSGALRLGAVPLKSGMSLYDAPNLLMQKFPGPAFTATTCLDAGGLSNDCESGLIVYGFAYAWIGIRRDDGRWVLVLEIDRRHARDSAAGFHETRTVSRSVTIGSPVVLLRVTVDPAAECRFLYSTDGRAFASFDNAPPFQATGDRWVGATVGVFAANLSDRSVRPATTQSHADFKWFRVSQ